MMTAAIAEAGWDRLRTDRGHSGDLGVPSLRLPVATGVGPVRLALGGQGEARLLVPVAPGERFPSVNGGGLELRDTVLTVGGAPVRFIDLACADERLEKVFRALVADVLRRLSEGSRAADAIENAVAEFRSLLIGAQRRLPSGRDALGLIGELRLLNQLLLIDDRAAELWTGPAGGRHDFRAGASALEVKTSQRSQRPLIEISALDQLCEPDGGELMLVHLVVEPDPGGAMSIVDEARRALGLARDRQLLAGKLGEAGYFDEYSDDWREFRFSVLSTSFYNVAEGFPRLTPAAIREAELPPGVSRFRYAVDLSYALEFQLAPHDAAARLGRVAECLHLS